MKNIAFFTPRQRKPPSDLVGACASHGANTTPFLLVLCHQAIGIGMMSRIMVRKRKQWHTSNFFMGTIIATCKICYLRNGNKLCHFPNMRSTTKTAKEPWKNLNFGQHLSTVKTMYTNKTEIVWPLKYFSMLFDIKLLYFFAKSCD